ncbi:MAG: 16S rRNA (guanine(527)-N(7))-methyltransferase RsmG [Xanthomonadaceae bacterium]|nr:16S rRNA (guanine(527)-N(7))-methyltransferase RsmG [Xanthomonadaceae bacterium]
MNHSRSWSPKQRAAAEQRLEQGLSALRQSLNPPAAVALLDYLAEMARWNKTYNLTSITDPLDMVDRHAIDSLAIRPFIKAAEVLDAGTGAGLPGVPLAIAEPGRHMTLVDSNGKKIRFLRHIKRSIGLENIEPLQARLEAIEPADLLESGHGDIVARALAPLPRLVEWLSPWLQSGWRLLAMKARFEEAERIGVPDAYNVRVEPLHWSGQRAERCLVIVTLGDPD